MDPQSQETWLTPETAGPGLRLMLPLHLFQRAESSGPILIIGPCGFSRKPPRLVTPTSHIPTPILSIPQFVDEGWAQFICTSGEGTAWMAPAPPPGRDHSTDIHVPVCVDFPNLPFLFSGPQRCSQDVK